MAYLEAGVWHTNRGCGSVCCQAMVSVLGEGERSETQGMSFVAGMLAEYLNMHQTQSQLTSPELFLSILAAFLKPFSKRYVYM